MSATIDVSCCAVESNSKVGPKIVDMEGVQEEDGQVERNVPLF